jgi:signal transduction histidine kinase
MALLLGVALLVAQLINFGLILNERQKLSLAQNEGPAITRFVTTASDLLQAPAEFKSAVLEDSARRGAQFGLATSASVGANAPRDAQIEFRLREALASAGLQAREVRAAVAKAPPRVGRSGRLRAAGDVQSLILSARLNNGQWLNGRLITSRRDPLLTARLAAATLLLYIIVLGATLFIAARIARPLADLARAAESFGGRGEPVFVKPRGSSDLRRALEAFNAMNRRVVSLLDEKDRMLGAIGHDLRTPLASLRIRAESMEPEEDRTRMIATIEEMNATLEDILVLARTGRAREPARDMDITALMDTVVEEFRDLGHDVALKEAERLVLPIQPNLLRRAFRNLIDNAVKYGGSAQVAVHRSGADIVVEVRDKGPGLAAADLEQVLEPFHRVEASRNRSTGGSGLGLAIAKAVAEGHGGTLRLDNGPSGGLIARLTISRRS